MWPYTRYFDKIYLEVISLRKGDAVESIIKLLIGNRFHVTIHIRSAETDSFTDSFLVVQAIHHSTSQKRYVS